MIDQSYELVWANDRPVPHPLDRRAGNRKPWAVVVRFECQNVDSVFASSRQGQAKT